jgi:hypothetical protein
MGFPLAKLGQCGENQEELVTLTVASALGRSNPLPCVTNTSIVPADDLQAGRLSNWLKFAQLIDGYRI